MGWVRPNVFDPRVGGNGRGVGDMANTYAFDGTRARKLGGGVAAPYGPRLRKGDVLGCLWDGPSQTISFRLNGASLEVAFSGVDPLTGLCPAVSVGSGARVILNFNSVKYLPEGFQCVEPTAAGLQVSLKRVFLCRSPFRTLFFFFYCIRIAFFSSFLLSRFLFFCMPSQTLPRRF